MNRCLFGVLLAFATVLPVGCFVGPPPCPGGTRGGTGGIGFFDSGEVQDDAFVAGKPRTFWVAMPERCGGALATSTAVSITDGNLNAVPASAMLEKVNSTYRANITFTPPSEGTYHLTASFEPNLGLAQRDLIVGVPRDDVPSQLASISRGGCLSFSVTQHGSIVCRRAIGEGSTVVRAGLPEETIVADTLSVTGNTVWVTHQGTVTRYVDDGSHLVKTDGPFNLPSGTEIVLGGDAFVWFINRNPPRSVTQLDRSGQGTPHAVPGVFSDMGNGTIHYAVTPEGSLLLGVFTYDDSLNLCRIEAKAGSALRCVNSPNELIGADSKGFWLIDPSLGLGTSRTLEHVMIDAEGDLKPRIARTLLPANFPIASEGSQNVETAFDGDKVPVFGIGTVPVHQSSGITFEVWPAFARSELTLAYEDVVLSFGPQTPVPLHVRKRPK